MATLGDSIDVYALVQQWSMTISAESIEGTRVYMEDVGQSMPDGSSKTTLPKLGDSWDSDYLNLTLKTITVTYILDNDNCPRKFVCNYNGVPFTQMAEPLSADDLPKNIEIGGEFNSWEPKLNTWKWASDDAPINKQVLNRRIALLTIRITRVIRDFDTYTELCSILINHVNDVELLGFPTETLLFNGANLYEFRNRAGQKRWKVDLQFVARFVTGNPAADGWNYQLRDTDGSWDKAINVATGHSTYLSASLESLFETDALGDDEDLYNQWPWR